MTTETLHQFMAENRIDVESIIQLINSGIEIEKIKLQANRALKSDTVSPHYRIIEGYNFLKLLRSGLR